MKLNLNEVYVGGSGVDYYRVTRLDGDKVQYEELITTPSAPLKPVSLTQTSGTVADLTAKIARNGYGDETREVIRMIEEADRLNLRSWR